MVKHPQRHAILSTEVIRGQLLKVPLFSSINLGTIQGKQSLVKTHFAVHADAVIHHFGAQDPFSHLSCLGKEAGKGVAAGERHFLS